MLGVVELATEPTRYKYSANLVNVELLAACVSMMLPTINGATSNQMRLHSFLMNYSLSRPFLTTCATIYVTFRFRSVYGRDLSQNKSAERNRRLLNFKSFDSVAVNGRASISHGWLSSLRKSCRLRDYSSH